VAREGRARQFGAKNGAAQEIRAWGRLKCLIYCPGLAERGLVSRMPSLAPRDASQPRCAPTAQLMKYQSRSIFLWLCVKVDFDVDQKSFKAAKSHIC